MSLPQDQDPYVALARYSLEHYVRKGEKAPLPDNLPEEMLNRRAGAFVSLHERGELRGCIGTIGPTASSLAEEILQNAISAAVDDPRFPPVEELELPELVINVDVLGEPESVESEDELDPKRYGVIVSCGHRRGLLLPDLEGVDTAEQQLEIARRKAGIPEHFSVDLERFEVIRHK